jgi:CBS-domain-containing membrane protein
LGCLASRGGSTQVKEVMTPVTLAMPEHASIARASALMAYEGVHRVVVVDVSGAVIGLVSPIDVLRWLAQKDGYAVP